MRPEIQLRDESHSFGILALVLWPLRKSLAKWIANNPDTHPRFAMGQILRFGEHPNAVQDTIERLAILGNGNQIHYHLLIQLVWLIGGKGINHQAIRRVAFAED